MGRIALAAVIVLVCAGAVRAEDRRRDGNYWNTQSRVNKADYVVGFMDGMELGEIYTLPTLRHSTDGKTLPESQACHDQASKEYDFISAHYYKDVTVGQIVDGLDEFYKDFKNRSILIAWGVDLVVRQIAGEDVEELLVVQRKNK